MRIAAIALAIATALAVGGCNRTGGTAQAGQAPVLQFDKPVSGEITSRSSTNFNDGTHYQLFQIQLEDQQRVGMKLTGALDGSITVFNNGVLVASSRSGYERGDEVAVAFRADGAGQYQVAVNADEADAFGPFRLRAEVLKPYDGKPIANAGQVSDLLLEDSQDYTLQVAAPGLYTIQLQSDAFDTVLGLTGEGLEIENDDSGDGTNSLIRVPLQPGKYTLRVRGLGASMGGAFKLDVQRSDMQGKLVDTDGTALPMSGSVYTQLDGEGRRRFLLSLTGTAEVRLDAMSSQVDTVLRLVGNGVERGDDDGGDGSDARLQETLGPGHYTVDVSSLSEEPGLVELRVQVTAPQEGPVAE